MTGTNIRPARSEDIPDLLVLLDVASFGFVEHAFRCLLKPGADVRGFITERMQDSTSALFYKKAQVIDQPGGGLAAFVMTEDIADPPDLLQDDTPGVFRPLLELESLAPGTRLVNFVGAQPEARGHGLGRALMEHAERSRGPNGMCLTVHDLNLGAQRLYASMGYRATDRRAIFKQGWQNPATDWLLMVKP